MELFPTQSLLWSTIIWTVALPYKMKLVCKTFETWGIFNARLWGIFSSEHEKSTYFTVPHTARGNVRNVERWEIVTSSIWISRYKYSLLLCATSISRRIRVQGGLRTASSTYLEASCWRQWAFHGKIINSTQNRNNWMHSVNTWNTNEPQLDNSPL